MTMISEFGDGSPAAPRVPIWCPGYRSRSSFAGSDRRRAVRAGEAKYSPGPGRCGIPGGTGASGPAAATSTRSIDWLPNWSVLESHQSPSDAEVAVDACQGSQQQTDAKRDSSCSDKDAQHGLSSTTQRQAKTEADQRRAASAEV